MKEYQKQLDTFSSNESKELTGAYFDKYWMCESDYLGKWLPIQQSIYKSISIKAGSEGRDRPYCSVSEAYEVIFKEGFYYMDYADGLCFTKVSLTFLQKIMKEIGDTHFAIIQDMNFLPYVPVDEHYKVLLKHQSKEIGHPKLQFVYPIDTTWEELMSGGDISRELFETAYKNFFVFGNSGKWGRYVVGDEMSTILGYHATLEQQFKDTYLHF